MNPPRWLSSSLLLAWMVSAGLARSEPLVPVGAVWRYQRATADSLLASGSWRQPGFSDADWALGRSGFSFGYSPYDDATSLLSAWGLPGPWLFRHSFNLPDPNALTWLVLRVDFDDGFVAYLNGQEVVRANVAGPPGRLVPASELASALNARGGTVEYDLTPFRSGLVPGRNVLAIQALHGQEWDYSFCLVPELVTDFTRGPFIQNTSSNSTQIIWKTPHPGDSEVEVRLGADAFLRIHETNAVVTHAVSVAGLAPGTDYSYRVRTTGEGGSVTSDWAAFRTLRSAGDLEFLVLGDGGSGSLAQYRVAEAMRRFPADFVLHTGDVVYPKFLPGLADTRCFSVYRDQMRTTPFFFAYGNHDLGYGLEVDIRPFQEAFYLPTNTATGSEEFYSFDHGDAHVAVLFAPFFYQYTMTAGDRQHTWLADDLARSTKPWKIVVAHMPLLSSGPHGRDDHNRNGVPDSHDLMRLVLPLASAHGVQVIFAGHDHAYERFCPTNGVHLVTTAGGGALLYGASLLDPASSQFHLQYHFVQVRIVGETMTLRAIDDAARVFDEFTIQRQIPVAQPRFGPWHTPLLSSGVADGDGNEFGQRFALAGEGWPALAGEASNLGRLFVNHDRTHLYLGLAQSMIRPDQTIYLFLEVPGMPGVSTLRGLGNGKLDPAGEGADGLDLLGQLEFEGFTPSFALLLGDEFADGQDRGHRRPAAGFASGQGLYRLTSGFPDGPLARLQQFNRSPQDLPVTGEQNANFVQLAIPLADVGAPGPSEMIQLAAVVGSAVAGDPPERGTVLLDSGFFGQQLNRREAGKVLLRGWPITLAPPPDADGDGLADDEEIRLGTNPLLADTDGDGLYDGWEVAHDLNPLVATGNSGGAGDPDGDGLSNCQEQWAGTDPRDTASALRVLVSWTDHSGMVVAWASVPGRSYQLEQADHAVGPFLAVPQDALPVKATGHRMERIVAAAQAHPVRTQFYRVRVAPPDRLP
jgi:hypothetical protein